MATIQDFRDLFVVINDETDRIAAIVSAPPSGLTAVETTEVLTSLQGAADKLKTVGAPVV